MAEGEAGGIDGDGFRDKGDGGGSGFRADSESAGREGFGEKEEAEYGFLAIDVVGYDHAVVGFAAFKSAGAYGDEFF